MTMIELEINKFVPPGRGMGIHNQKAVFISGTITGDIVQANIVKEKKDHIIASLHKIITPSKKRAEIPCPYFLTCGACDLMQLKYEHQIHYKQQFLKELIKSNGFSLNPDWIESPKTEKFRCRAQLKSIKGQIGYISRNSNELVSIDNCKILSDPLNAQISHLSKLAYQKAEFHILNAQNSDQVSIYVKQGKDSFLLPGTQSEITENYGYGDMQLNASQFAQSNPFITRLMIDAVVNSCQQATNVCEIYCGSGTFTVPIAQHVDQISGYELNSAAIQIAKDNVKHNNLKNVKLIAVNADKIKIKPNIDTIVVDPPRAGLSAKVRNTIRRSKAKRMIYISCNPASMMRDINDLTAKDRFSLKSVTGYDMYCQSTHLEALAILDT